MCIVLFYRADPDVLENKLDYHPVVCCAFTDHNCYAMNLQH